MLVIDVPPAERLRLADVRRLIGRPVSEATVRRWYTEGIGGIRLKAVRDFGRWITTERWLREFLQAVQDQAAGSAANTPRRRRSAGGRGHA